MYAIKNKRTGKWWYGTDRSRMIGGSWTQRTSFEKAITFDDWEAEMPLGGKYTALESEMRSRRMGKDYVPVKVKLVEVTQHDA